MVYLEFSFTVSPSLGTEILIAQLANEGFESFVEQEDQLLAYVLKNDLQDVDLSAIQIIGNEEFNISWTVKEIEQQNWNATWEENFHPILINDRCGVRAPFHDPQEVTYDIIIEPKMSFGTGHHETTAMMLQLLLDEPVAERRVLDMGCGTGVLAILADRLGAQSVDAIDVDPWCVENSIENCERNKCFNIQVQLGDSSLLTGRNYDIILANINRNVLLDDIPIYANCLKGNGVLLLSGFYLHDLDVISAKCGRSELKFEKKVLNNNWIAVKYVL